LDEQRTDWRRHLLVNENAKLPWTCTIDEIINGQNTNGQKLTSCSVVASYPYFHYSEECLGKNLSLFTFIMSNKPMESKRMDGLLIMKIFTARKCRNLLISYGWDSVQWDPAVQSIVPEIRDSASCAELTAVRFLISTYTHHESMFGSR